MVIAALLTIPVPVAPLPTELPAYRVACSGGEMSGVRLRLLAEAGGQNSSRRGHVEIDGQRVPATVRAERMALSDAVGGAGFVDQFEFEHHGQRYAARIGVRGDIQDDLIMFSAIPLGTPRNPAIRGVTGACHSIGGPNQEGMTE